MYKKHCAAAKQLTFQSITLLVQKATNMFAGVSF